jgi:hypothetical protein
MPPKPCRLIALSSVIHVPHHPIKQMDQFVTGNFGQFRAGHDFCPRWQRYAFRMRPAETV